jgi:hypothetical protein
MRLPRDLSLNLAQEVGDFARSNCMLYVKANSTKPNTTSPSVSSRSLPYLLNKRPIVYDVVFSCVASVLDGAVLRRAACNSPSYIVARLLLYGNVSSNSITPPPLTHNWQPFGDLSPSHAVVGTTGGKDFKLPARTVKHLFSELRKAANHPLLLRRLYAQDDKVCSPFVGDMFPHSFSLPLRVSLFCVCVCVCFLICEHVQCGFNLPVSGRTLGSGHIQEKGGRGQFGGGRQCLWTGWHVKSLCVCVVMSSRWTVTN